MQKIYLLFSLTISTLFAFSQDKYGVTYSQLKEYEGLYQYTNNGTLPAEIIIPNHQVMN